ncbi:MULTISPECIES: phosphopantetheine-binding protein [Bacillus]|uniref:phosphopantetheine-binding protein n=1 Tax=Bacillus TaxID=1386 RepID=UPI000DC4D956|nr:MULTISPECIES: phosphopantetheine-binding protein [Bacillus]RAN76600.1 acyl carrier protein [Bacillus sp. SRB_331]USL15358.1 phosphopantetheine-binding protein [Bacillus thuringiensis]
MKNIFIQVLNNYLSDDVSNNFETTLKDMGLDSMASIELLLELEDQFDIVFPDELLTEETFSTAKTLWESINKLTPDKAGC